MDSDSVENRVLDDIYEKRSETISFLKSLVKIPSITGSCTPEKEIQTLVAKRLEGIGCKLDVWEPKIEDLKSHSAYVRAAKSYRDRPIVVGVLKGTGGGRSIILNGHVDVVTPEPVESWIHDPWKAEVENGLLYGRGAADMKGGVASMIMALESIKRANVKLKGDVIVESVLDEELGGDGTLACILRGYQANAGIVTEPTELGINPAQSGGLIFKIRVPGKSAHAGLKFEGVSAFEKAVKLVSALNQLEKQRNRQHRLALFKRFPIQVPLNIGIVRSGEWVGTVPEEATIEGAMGCLPGEKMNEVAKELEDAVADVAKEDAWMKDNKPIIEWSSFRIEPSSIPVRHPIVNTFATSSRQIMKKRAFISGFPAGCDMRLLVKYANTPTIIFGPGSLTQAHTVDEYLPLNELISSTEIIALSLLRWCEIEN
jgi:acetylornithine deacetylase